MSCSDSRVAASIAVTLRIMSAVLPAGWPAGSSRRLAAGLLLLAWAATVAASYLGDPAHALAPRLLTAFLLWRIWRGANWSRYLLIGLSCISAGFAVGLAAVTALGATGVVARSVAMFAQSSGASCAARRCVICPARPARWT